MIPKTRLLAATRTQDFACAIQISCDRYFEQLNQGQLPYGVKETFENDVAELFLALLSESKYLQERISQVTNKPFDLAQIEAYGI